MLVLFAALIIAVIVMDSREIKSMSHKGKIVGVYVLIMGINVLIGILLIAGKRPLSPSELIQNLIQWIGGGK